MTNRLIEEPHEVVMCNRCGRAFMRLIGPSTVYVTDGPFRRAVALCERCAALPEDE